MGREEKGENEGERGRGRKEGKEWKGQEGRGGEWKEEFIPQCSLAVDALSMSFKCALVFRCLLSGILYYNNIILSRCG